MAKKEVTKKQGVILLLVYLFRFVNSKQIQEFLSHKDHRRINAWLKELVAKEYLERDYKVVYGTLTKPAVYNLSAKGRKYIKEGFSYYFPHYLKKIARDNKASKSFKIRCQIVADLYLLWFPPLEEKITKNDNEKEEMLGEKIKIQKKEKSPKVTSDTPSVLASHEATQVAAKIGIAIADYMTHVLIKGSKNAIPLKMSEWQFFTSSYFPGFILLEKLKPDAYFRSKSKEGIHHAIIYVLDAYIPRFLLRYTLKRIFDTLDEEYWNDDDLASLHFYFVCPNNVIITYMTRMLKSTIERYYESKELTFRFATRNQLYKEKKNPKEKIKWKIVSSEDSDY